MSISDAPPLLTADELLVPARGSSLVGEPQPADVTAKDRGEILDWTAIRSSWTGPDARVRNYRAIIFLGLVLLLVYFLWRMLG